MSTKDRLFTEHSDDIRSGEIHGPQIFARPPIPGGRGELPAPPDRARCTALWDKYEMPEHIREHSRLVALVATSLAERAIKAGLDVDVAAVEASALLHDIAKLYTITWGGNHAQVGAAWALEETGRPDVAMGVMHHVFWPWDMDLAEHFLPLAVIYGDKRVRHDQIVTLDERFEDLVTRYGRTSYIRGRIEVSRVQAVDIEHAFNRELGVDLNASSFDSGRLVRRT